jgi:hypothetical protein
MKRCISFLALPGELIDQGSINLSYDQQAIYVPEIT